MQYALKRFVSRSMTGALAGLLATGVMSLVMLGAKRLGALGEPPPRRLVRRMSRALLPAARRGAALDAAALAAHFAYGAALGSLFSLLPQRARGKSFGALYGLGVWAVNYAGWLPKVGLMPKPRHDRPGRQPAMVAAHLAYGVTLAAASRSLGRDANALRGKVVVVAGGTRGLGLAVARELLRNGARVAICGRSPEALARARESLTRESLKSMGEPVLSAVCDLRDEQQTAAFLARVSRERGPIDVLVANAATIDVGPIASFTVADFEAAMRDIFGTALQTTLAVLPEMRARRRGRIVLISSIGGKVGVPHLAPYSAAKFAVAGFGEALEAEVAKDGVGVLTVMPGLMRTGSHIHARFHGAAERELHWFGASAIAPLMSIDADRAARKVVAALLHGDRFLTYTPAARLGAWLHDRAPNAWSLLSSVVGRFLPNAPREAAPGAHEGIEILRRSSSRSRLSRLIARSSAPLSLRHNQ